MTHTRFAAWFVGIIAGYVFVEFPHGSVQIPKVFTSSNECHAIIVCQINSTNDFFLLHHIESEFVCMGAFNSYAIVWNIWTVSILPIG